MIFIEDKKIIQLWLEAIQFLLDRENLSEEVGLYYQK